MLEPMEMFEGQAWAVMLADAVHRYRRAQANDLTLLPVRSRRVRSYRDVAAALRAWQRCSPSAAVLGDDGLGTRAGDVAELDTYLPWPPPGILAAADGSWVLEPDLRLTRLY